MSDSSNVLAEPISKSSSNNELFRCSIVEHIAKNKNAFVRNQQINDPDLSIEERKNIVESTWNAGHVKFLATFGRFMVIDHLAYFESVKVSTSDDDKYELQYYLKYIRDSINNRQKLVRNRRFTAMQRLIDQDDYFSEMEMLKREPLLYEQLVGQFMTANEKNRRDCSATDGDNFSNELLNRLDLETIDKLRKEQQLAEDAENDDSSSDDQEIKCGDAEVNGVCFDEEFDARIPASYHKHWGDMEDEPGPSYQSQSQFSVPSTSQQAVSDSRLMAQLSISIDERELLWKEFFTIMCTNFLDGKDSTFDYETVDDNSEYDNLDIENQDAEDKYFESDDDNPMDKSQPENSDNDSEDDLDVYMKQINQET